MASSVMAATGNQLFLQPGELCFVDQPASIETILGSCVAVTMLDPVSGQAAMCHCLLPCHPAAATAILADRHLYVDTSIEDMLAEFQVRSVPVRRLEVKLFGGANVINALSEERAIGSRNWQLAKRVLTEANLRLSAHDVGGKNGRRIIFQTASGEVLVKPLGK